MVDEVDNLVEFMLKAHLVRSQLPDLSFMWKYERYMHF